MPPPVSFAAFLFAGIGLGWLRPWSLGLSTTGAQLVWAVPPFGVGAALGLWALREFRRAGATNAPFAEPTALVTSGPFGFSRNPLYLAHLLILTALAGLLDSAWVLLFVPAHAAVLDRLVIRGEEARLQRAFGERYRSYCLCVRRWV